MNVRKMITLSPRGAELLNEATGGAKEMATGQYLTMVLAQRRRAWMLALEDLLVTGASHAEILAAIREATGLHLAPHSLMARLAHLHLLETYDHALALQTLIHEYEAGNAALLQALEGKQ